MVFFQVTFDSPKWRSPNPWKGHLKPPRRSLGRTRWTKPSLLCSSRYFSMGVICFFLITKVFLELGRSPSERTNPSTNSGSVFVMSLSDRGSLRTPVKMAQMLHGTWNVYLDLTIITTGFWNVLLEKLIWNSIMKVLKRWLSRSSRWFLRGVISLQDGGFGRRLFSSWDGIVSGAMLASGRVNNTQQTAEHQESS